MSDRAQLDLETFFDAARKSDAAIAPSARMVEMTLAAAAGEDRFRRSASGGRRQRAGWWAGLAVIFGGSGGLAGAATAGIAALWLGFAQADQVLGLASAFLPQDVLTATDTAFGELTAYELGE